MRTKFPDRVFLPEDEEEVRRLIVRYQSMQVEQQQLQDRRCYSASNIARASISNSYNRESRSGEHPDQGPSHGVSHVHFAPLAPGRSPVMKRRTLPSPIPTARGAKTV